MINKDTPFEEILGAIHWKSYDKDNMEYTAVISYAIMDRIRKFLDEYDDDLFDRQSAKRPNSQASEPATGREHSYGGL